MARLKSLRRRNRQLGMNVALMFIMILYLLPLYYVLNNVFKQKEYISTQPFFITFDTLTFDNITEAFVRMDFISSFINSASVVILTCIMLVVLGSLTGFGVVYAKNKSLDRLYYIYIALISMPLQIAMVPLIVLLRNFGLTDTYIGMALIYNAVYLPFVVFLYTGFMRTIPRELIDAGKIDGCTPFGIYARIFMPLLTTITGMIVVMRSVTVWNDLFVPLIAVNKPYRYTLIQMLYTFTASKQGQWHLVFGATFLCIIPVIILFLVLQKSFIRNVMSGSIKG